MTRCYFIIIFHEFRYIVVRNDSVVNHGVAVDLCVYLKYGMVLRYPICAMDRNMPGTYPPPASPALSAEESWTTLPTVSICSLA
jgi:hypothetical protein